MQMQPADEAPDPNGPNEEKSRKENISQSQNKSFTEILPNLQ